MVDDTVKVHNLGLQISQPHLVDFWSEDVDLKVDTESPVLLRTLYSGVSAGTELSLLLGTNPQLRAGRIGPQGYFKADAPSSMRFPLRKFGYMNVSEVVESTSKNMVGKFVSGSYGHRAYSILTQKQWSKSVTLPESLCGPVGVFVGKMAPICGNALLHADAIFDRAADFPGSSLIRRRVLVMGAGMIGVITALWARSVGADVILWDDDGARTKTVEGLGLEVVHSSRDDAVEAIYQSFGTGADVAFQCRGVSQYLAIALKSLVRQGLVVSLAFYQDSAAGLWLGEDFHHSGHTIRSAQIGNLPTEIPQWSGTRLREAGLKFVEEYQELLLQTIALVKMADAPDVYRRWMDGSVRGAEQVVFEFPTDPLSG